MAIVVVLPWMLVPSGETNVKVLNEQLSKTMKELQQLITLMFRIVRREGEILFFSSIAIVAAMSPIPLFFWMAVRPGGVQKLHALSFLLGDDDQPASALISLTGWDFAAVVALAAGIYWLAYLIGGLAQGAVTACLWKSLNGERSTLSDGWKAMRGNFIRLLSWSLLSAAILTGNALLRSRVIGAARYFSHLGSLAWLVGTLFLVPMMVIHNLSPKQAFERSVGLMRERFSVTRGQVFLTSVIGDTVIRFAAFSGVAFLTMFLLADYFVVSTRIFSRYDGSASIELQRHWTPEGKYESDGKAPVLRPLPEQWRIEVDDWFDEPFGPINRRYAIAMVLMFTPYFLLFPLLGLISTVFITCLYWRLEHPTATLPNTLQDADGLFQQPFREPPPGSSKEGYA